MKKYPQLAVSLSALIAYAAIVCAGYFHARAKLRMKPAVSIA